MDTLLYWAAKVAVTFLQSLPLTCVARIGRGGGAVAWMIDRRHREVAIENLSRALNQGPSEVKSLAHEHFKRLGENYACAIKTAAMNAEQLANHLEITGGEHLQNPDGTYRGAVFAVGHFGNFELYPRGSSELPGFQFATTYRALKQRGLNRLLLELRQRSGAWLFERRLDGEALRAAMAEKKLIVGLFSDQHAGRHGAWIPFFGRDCSTTTAPAIFASRYKLPLLTAVCYRVRLGHWRIEVGKEIPTSLDGRRRLAEDIMRDVNLAFEEAVRRDPANWFWVHKRWKPAPAPNVAEARSSASARVEVVQ